MYKIPKQENVEFKQVKLKGDALEFRAVIKVPDGEKIYENNLNDTYVHSPHEDLKNSIEKLKVPFAQICGFIDAKTMIEAKDFKANAEQKKALESYVKQKLHDIVITGAAFSGDGGRWGVKITGHYKGMAITSSKIFIGKDNLELFENEIRETVDKINDETYKYVFEGKKGDIEYFDSAQTAIDGTGEQFEKDTGIKKEED